VNQFAAQSADSQSFGISLAVNDEQTVSDRSNIMQNSHRKAAEQHELAAHAHRTAAEHHEKGDGDAASWHADRALEYSDRAYKLAKEAHNKSGQMVSI
jgi:hypothetical protein